MKVQVYPIALGNHENTYFVAKIKNVITFKIMGLQESGTAHVLTFSTSINNIEKYLDSEKILIEIQEKIDKWSFTVVTKKEDLFIRRGTEKQKYFKEALFN